jgi:hypothetical protein
MRSPFGHAAERLGLLGLLVGAALGAGCSSDADGNGSTNQAGTAGAVNAAGAATNGGGGSASGGMTSAAGATNGSAGTPQAGAPTGGASTAGASTGGASTAGSPMGGASAGGAAGGSAAGAGAGGLAMGGAGGMSGKGGSPGCGSANPLKSGNFSEMIDGTKRDYVLDVPTDYKADKPYRLIFVWHPLGGSASQVVGEGYGGLKSQAAGSAIFVAGDGLMGSNSEASGKGWWNVNGGDIKFLTALLAKLTANLCVDQDRIFSTGYSFVGILSETVGYQVDVFLEIGPCYGDL